MTAAQTESAAIPHAPRRARMRRAVVLCALGLTQLVWLLPIGYVLFSLVT